MSTVELSFSALPGHVRTARLIAAVVARRAGVDESVLDEVRLAVGEACTRAVDLHRRFCPQVPVHVTFSHDDAQFEALVRDSAPAEDTLAAGALEALEHEAATAAEGAEPLVTGAEPARGLGIASASPPAQRGVGSPHDVLPQPEAAFQPLPPGVGLAVIGGIVDEVDVEADQGGVRVRMRWPLPRT